MKKNPIDILNTLEDFKDVRRLYDEAIFSSSSDPSSSILKSSLALEVIVGYLLKKNSISYFQNDTLHIKINRLLKDYLPPSITNQMNAIRTQRNMSSAHYNSDVSASRVDSIYILKALYNIILFLLNEIKAENYQTFEDFFESSHQSLSKEEKKVIQSTISLPKFYIDPEYEVKFKDIVDDLTEETAMNAIKLFLTTTVTLKGIEEAVFKQPKKGDTALAIIMLYKNIGLTQGWREFIKEYGIKETIKLLDEHLSLLKPDGIDYSKLTTLRSILLKIL